MNYSIKFQGHTGRKIDLDDVMDLDPIWARPITSIKSLRFALLSFIKSPQYTGGDFMFLYRFVRRRRSRRRRPQILVHAITFEQLFGFLSFLAQLLALTCRLPD